MQRPAKKNLGKFLCFWLSTAYAKLSYSKLLFYAEFYKLIKKYIIVIWMKVGTYYEILNHLICKVNIYALLLFLDNWLAGYITQILLPCLLNDPFH